VIVRFDIGGIDDHHRLNFLSIIHMYVGFTQGTLNIGMNRS
jgi:hypothetical protein